MATSFTTHSAGQIITSADVNLIQTAVNALENSAFAGGPQPANMPVPAKAWTIDPGLVASTATSNLGLLSLAGIYVAAPITVTKVYTCVTSAGSTTHAFAGVWTAAAGGALLRASTDSTTAGGTTGLVTYTLTSSLALTAGWYYVGFWWAGTVAPQMLANSSGSGTGMNVLTVAGNRRAVTADTGLSTTAPATLGTQTNTNNHYWIALA